MMAAHALDPQGRLRMIIFDCDGVLVDSEGPSCLMVAAVARSYGLDIPDEDCVHHFAGKALDSVQKEIEQATGRDLGTGFVPEMQQKMIDLMQTEAQPIDGAAAMLDGIVSLNLPYRVGSNSSVPEMDAKFERVGFSDRFPMDRIHSARDMGQPKPSPAVYLHAAAMDGIPAENCVVIEDSNTGARAARAAGMACVLLRSDEDVARHEALEPWPGLVRIGHLDELVPFLRRTLDAQRAGA